MTRTEYNDFIGHYYNVYPDGYCQHLIKQFDNMQQKGFGLDRKQSENAQTHIKNDFQISIGLKFHHLEDFNNMDSVDTFFKGLQSCYEDYTSKYSVLSNMGRISCTHVKMQKTYPGGGYHVWHGEQASGPHAARVLTYILYLNSLTDEKDGAETEFLYQRTRVKPQENLLLIWPAAFTHAHRGNPVLSNKFKYIVTGWFYLES